MQEIVLKSILAFSAAFAGGMLIFLIKLNHHKLCSLISLSAGALSAAAGMLIYGLVGQGVSPLVGLGSLATGFLFFHLFNKYVYHMCPACSASHFDMQTTKKFSEISILLYSALALHSFVDGFAISFFSADHHSGEGAFYAILTHKFPEGIALASLMAGAGYKRGTVILSLILVEGVTIIGGVTGSLISLKSVNSATVNLVEAAIAGSFLYLSYHAIAGELLKNHKKLVITSFAAGLMLILAVQFFIF